MKRLFKGASLSLCAMLLLAGCSCDKKTADTKANISNPKETLVSGLKDGVNSITLQEIYDELKAQQGNSVSANKLLEMVSNLVLSDAKWQARYNAKVDAKLMEFVDAAEYKVDGVFNEELLVKTLKAQLYDVTCENGTYGPTYNEGVVDKYMVCDYTDYVNKALKISILTELLNEKYVYDKVMVDKANILTTKKARLVEYISLPYSGTDEEDDVIAHISEAVANLTLENSTTSLEDIAESWTDKKIGDLVEKYNKINTKDDANGSIMSDFTGGYTYSPEKGLELKKQEVYNSSNYDKVVITSDSKEILNSTLVERLLSENVLSQTANKTIKINNGYYLVAPWAGNNVTATDIRIKDATNSKYYIVKVDVINSDSSEDNIYEAVKVLAKNSTLVSDSVNYYLEQHKDNINVYDEEIYNYLKTQYADIFVD
jgi:hypothetical protein